METYGLDFRARRVLAVIFDVQVNVCLLCAHCVKASGRRRPGRALTAERGPLNLDFAEPRALPYTLASPWLAALGS